MDHQDRRLEIVQEYLTRSLNRNRRLITVLCEGVIVPDTLPTHELHTGIENVKLTTYFRQDNLPVLIQGDLVVIHR